MSSELKLGISANISFKLNELCHNKKGKSPIILWKRSNRSNFTFMSLRLNFIIPFILNVWTENSEFTWRNVKIIIGYRTSAIYFNGSNWPSRMSVTNLMWKHIISVETLSISMWKYQVLKNIECLNKKKKYYFDMKTPKGPGLIWKFFEIVGLTFVDYFYLQFRCFPIIIGRQLYWYEHVAIIEFVVLKSVSHAVCFFYQYNYVEAFLPTELQLQLRICVYIFLALIYSNWNDGANICRLCCWYPTNSK